MADAGSIWFHALSSVGENIGKVIEQKHKEHQKYDELDAFLKMGQQMTRPGADGTPTPVFDKKTFQYLQNQLETGRMRNLGAIEMATKIQRELAVSGAKASIMTDELQKRHESDQALQPITYTDDQGREWRKGKTGWIPMSQPKKSLAQDKDAERILNPVTIERGKLKNPSQGPSANNFTNQYTEAGSGDHVKLVLDNGKQVVMKWDQYQDYLKRQNKGVSSGESQIVDQEKVKVKSPDGRTGRIPRNQLKTALAQGYTQVE